jgi:hypothetical protein
MNETQDCETIKSKNKRIKYLKETLKSDLNVGCIPMDVGAC